MFLLDTNVVSEMRKTASGKANSQLIAWARRFDASDFYISAITILELELGILSIERKDSEQGRILRNWFENQVLPEFENRILSVDEKVALRCASLHVPDKRSERDALIAATALVHGMTVATRNVTDFEPTGVKVFNPWEDL